MTKDRVIGALWGILGGIVFGVLLAVGVLLGASLFRSGVPSGLSTVFGLLMALGVYGLSELFLRKSGYTLARGYPPRLPPVGWLSVIAALGLIIAFIIFATALPLRLINKNGLRHFRKQF